MSVDGTARYRTWPHPVPELVAQAVAEAERLGFAECCHPAVGRLLAALAGGVGAGTVVETGTGTGAGLAWMVSACGPDTRFVGVELDHRRAEAAARLLSRHSNVQVVHGDAADHWYAHLPDLLVLDGGGGTGKAAGDVPLDPRRALSPAGTLVIDDFAPMGAWPPRHGDRPDLPRLHWLTHPDLLATELRVAADLAVLVARLRAPA